MTIPNSFHRVHMPHIDQSNGAIPTLSLHDPENRNGDGKRSNKLTYCAPVVAAQTLIGRVLAEPKLQSLLPSQGSKTEAHYKSGLIDDLAKAMGTSNDLSDPNVGTTPQQFMHGLERFAGDRNFKFTNDSKWLGGWGAGEVNSQLSAPPPDKRSLAAHIARPDMDVTGHVGWYQDPESGLYQRKGGHFVAFEGVDAANSANPKFTLQDPSPRSLRQITRVAPREISNGTLVNGDKSTPANNYLKLEGIHSKVVEGKPTKGILDGAFAFGLERK